MSSTKSRPSNTVYHRRFIRMKSMVQMDQPRCVLIGTVEVDYYRSWQVERTDTFLQERPTGLALPHGTPSTASYELPETIRTDQVIHIERPYDFLYAFCSTRPELFTARQRRVLEQHYGQCLKERQIARVLNLTSGTIRRDIAAVRRAIRRYCALVVNAYAAQLATVEQEAS